MYRQIAKTYEPTKPSINIEIGIRTKPYPNGIPGYLRLDSVSQGNKDDEKGLFHINIVDEVTQFEFVISVPQISEKYMIKALEQIIQMFPFKILGFHSDNGKEYINRKVCALLNRLNIRQTKSRARRSNDNALVESKKGAIIRKHIGYTFIGQKYANLVNKYYMEYLNVYLNFYRPCGFATEVKDKRGKIKKVYKYEDYKTPYEAFKKLSNMINILKREFR